MKTKARKVLKIIIPILFSVILMLICTFGFYQYGRKRQYTRNLITAIKNNDMEELARLIEQGGDISALPYSIFDLDVENHAPLFYAAYYDNFEAVKMLVEAGADVNAAACNGWSPLYGAIHFAPEENFRIARYLIEHGADIHYNKDVGGRAAISSLLNTAPGGEDEELFSFFLYLLEKGAYLEESPEGHVLFDACRSDSNILIVQYIFENYDIDINMRSQHKRGHKDTLLMRTTCWDASQVCALLLRYGADKTLTNSEGKTAYDLAIQYGGQNVAALLE